MRGNGCPLSTVVTLCLTLVAVLFILQHGRDPMSKGFLSMKFSGGEKQEQEKLIVPMCINETLFRLSVKVNSFLDGNEEKRKTENETKIVNYSKFMQMCARQKAISSCQRVSENGNYCKNDNVAADAGFIKAVTEMKLFSGKRVASIGEGTGYYRKALKNETAEYDGFDGNPFIEYISGGTVRFFDLTVPTHFPNKYDVTVSLEVIEHIPKQFESAVVRNLAESSKDVLIISWAKLGQGGLAHVNCQPREYVVKTFENFGFVLDTSVSEVLRNSSTYRWHRDNILLFRKKNN